MAETREITRDQYLKAHALFHMAHATLGKLHEYERELAAVLEVPEDDFGGYGHVSDGIFDESYTINTIMKKENLIVKK